MFFTKWFIFTLLFFLDYSNGASLPNSIKKCKRNSPTLNTCFKEEGKKFFKMMLPGLPALGIPSLNPLKFKNSNITNGQDGLSLFALNTELFGLKDAIFKDIKVDLQKKYFTFDFTMNAIIKLSFDASGKFLAFPVAGLGDIDIIVDGASLQSNMNWELKKRKDNKEHIHIKTMKTKQSVESIRVKLNTFENQILGETISNVINMNWKDTYQQFASPTVEMFEKEITGILNKFFAKVPYDELFPL